MANSDSFYLFYIYFWSLMVVLIPVWLWSVGIVATCIAAVLLSVVLYDKEFKIGKIDVDCFILI